MEHFTMDMERDLSSCVEEIVASYDSRNRGLGTAIEALFNSQIYLGMKDSNNSIRLALQKHNIDSTIIKLVMAEMGEEYNNKSFQEKIGAYVNNCISIKDKASLRVNKVEEKSDSQIFMDALKATVKEHKYNVENIEEIIKRAISNDFSYFTRKYNARENVERIAQPKPNEEHLGSPIIQIIGENMDMSGEVKLEDMIRNYIKEMYKSNIDVKETERTI